MRSRSTIPTIAIAARMTPIVLTTVQNRRGRATQSMKSRPRRVLIISAGPKSAIVRSFPIQPARYRP